MKTISGFVRCLLVTSLFAGGLGPAVAQQSAADRLWQGVEQQAQQLRRDATPAPLPTTQDSLHEAQRAMLTQTPHERVQQLTFAILNAVNHRDWFGADRLLRQYALVPQHDPALMRFVDASRSGASGDFGSAIDAYREVLAANPGFTRGTLDLARVLYADNRLQDAREAFDRLRTQALPPEVLRHIDEHLAALARREKPSLSLSLSVLHEDNVNSASTVVDPCALVFAGECLQNHPGEKLADSGLYFEATLNKLWPLAGNHGVLLRSINYSNQYRHETGFNSLISTTYFGYQYASANSQIQLLPLFELDDEGNRKIYHAFGARAVVQHQIDARTQIEASYEFKARRFSEALESLQGAVHSISLFASQALRPDLLVYGQLVWRDSDARLPVFAYREKVARVGVQAAIGDAMALNLSYGYRLKAAEGVNAFFGKRQRDHENSIYLNVALPGYAWEGLTPSVSYEYRNNRSSIAHAYNYEKNRLTVGFSKVF